MEEKLTELKEIILPEPVSYLPQTVAWVILFGLLLMATIWLAVRWYRHWAANRYRKAALKRLAEIEMNLSDSASRATSISALPVLVKQTTLAFAAREKVAGLSGKRWLTFLDSTYIGWAFTEGPGKLLPELSYWPVLKLERVSDDELQALIGLLRKWIRRHRAAI